MSIQRCGLLNYLSFFVCSCVCVYVCVGGGLRVCEEIFPAKLAAELARRILHIVCGGGRTQCQRKNGPGPVFLVEISQTQYLLCIA